MGGYWAHDREAAHGKKLVAALTEALPDNLKFTTEEILTLGDIENAGDRLEVLRAGFASRRVTPRSTENRLAMLSAEIRLIEDAIGRGPGR